MRWSQLKGLVEDLFDPTLELQIFCTVHRSESGPSIGRHWITLKREIVWECPRRVAPLIVEGRGDDAAPIITSILRSYIESSPELLLAAEPDAFGLSEILIAADRRLGKRRLLPLLQRFTPGTPARTITELRIK